MPEAVMVALIGAAQAITLALLGMVASRLGKVKNDVGRVKSDAAAARWQVENTHDTNLREENDSRHAETKRWIDGLQKSVTDQLRNVGKDIGGIREEIRDDRRATRDRFADLERRIQQKETP